jgi:hypothetical protein
MLLKKRVLRKAFTQKQLNPKEKLGIFLPTTCLKALHVLHQYMPQHHALFADFSQLPDSIAGVNSPVVIPTTIVTITITTHHHPLSTIHHHPPSTIHSHHSPSSVPQKYLKSTGVNQEHEKWSCDRLQHLPNSSWSR